MRTVYYLIALALVIFVSKLIFVNKAEAGGPWSNQYCDVETTTIRVVDANGVVLEERTEEKVTCSVFAYHLLFDLALDDVAVRVHYSYLRGLNVAVLVAPRSTCFCLVDKYQLGYKNY